MLGGRGDRPEWSENNAQVHSLSYDLNLWKAGMLAHPDKENFIASSFTEATQG
jgi:hypothetical protein